MLFTVGRVAFRVLDKVESNFYRGLSVGFIAGFVGLLFHAIGANTFIIVRIMEPFWFFAGIITVLPMIEQESNQPREVV